MSHGFVEGRTYNRRKDVHENFGGQRQGGIITPVGHPYVFCVTGKAGESHGYGDEWQEDGGLLYFGEGQLGDMQFVRGNRAVRDHALDGKELLVFEKQPGGSLMYRGQFICSGYQEIPDVPDTSGALRMAIAFEFVREHLDEEILEEAATDLSDLDLTGLRAAALAPVESRGDRKTASKDVYYRSAAVSQYVRARAHGTCEGCGNPAPFLNRKGEPYLEPHHTTRVSDGGPDHPAHVIALCPTCHRRIHSGEDGDSYNSELIDRLKVIEEKLDDSIFR